MTGRQSALARLTCALVSGFTLASAFAPFENSGAVWLAFVPLIVASYFATFAQAFRMGWVSGLVFWLCTIRWLLALIETDVYGLPPSLIVAGYLLLSCFLALYTAVFCALVQKGLRASGVLDWTLNIVWVVVIPVVWVGLEYLRGTLVFGGFPWCQVGVSQYANTMLIQCASLGGVYAVSFVVLSLNSAIAMVVLRRIELHRTGGRSRFHPELMLGLSIFAYAVLNGRAQMSQTLSAPTGDAIRVTAVEPGVTFDKWTGLDEVEMYEDLLHKTASAAIPTNPDLVIWPETALLWVDDPLAESFLSEVGKLRYPILFGALQVKLNGVRLPDQYNSSFLYEPGKGITQEYSKHHLVPFGEYLPLKGVFALLGLDNSLAPPCSPGTTNTVFELGARKVPFSSLICFEDTVAKLARASVDNGARLLVVQTNDAWFEGTGLLKQHMVHAVFRAVENRVPLVRVGNTGISCAVDVVGRLRSTDHPGAQRVLAGDDHSETYYWDVQTAAIDLQPTWYRRVGDLPVAIAGWVSLVAFVLAIIQHRLKDGREQSLSEHASVASPAGEENG